MERKDGYHELVTDLTAVDLWDKFTLTLASQKTIQKDYSLEDKNDLICKAINLLEQITKKSFAYHLKIEKFIPMGAGLGGGSSNAAAILFAFNQIFNLQFSLKELARLGEKLGADVPFFLHQKQLRMGGKGAEIIKKIKIPDYPLLILLPEFQSNTYDAYQSYKQSNIPVNPSQKINYSPTNIPVNPSQKINYSPTNIPVNPSQKINYSPTNIPVNPSQKINYSPTNIPVNPSQKINYSPTELKNFSVSNNDLYSAVLKIHPTLKQHLQILETTQPLATQMSGSGSSLFAIYENTAIRNNAYNSLQNSKPEKREQKNPSSKKTEQPFTLYKTQILPTFDFFNKP